eukprot:766984-Hanusia_phi.AAC.1
MSPGASPGPGTPAHIPPLECESSPARRAPAVPLRLAGPHVTRSWQTVHRAAPESRTRTTFNGNTVAGHRHYSPGGNPISRSQRVSVPAVCDLNSSGWRHESVTVRHRYGTGRLESSSRPV